MKLQAILIFAAWRIASCAELKDKRQVGTAVVTEETDRETAETGFSDAVQAGSKFFQYAHVPAKDHYEFGHRRGNEHHFIERHEKAHPHAGEFKTKVRWGDKHGGYGEHYWDYNHAGHGHDGDGEESQNEEEYTAYDGSEQIPVVATATVKSRQRRNLPPKISDDVEYINDRARFLVESGATGRHGGNYRKEDPDGAAKTKRHNYKNKFDVKPESEATEINSKSEKQFFNYDY